MISVIIPSYKNAAYVAEAVESALSQRGSEPLEVIVVDDGSDDGTEAVCAPFVAAHHGRVRYFRIDNAGQAAARNYGMRRAQGEYIALLDADDAWMPEKISKQLVRMRETNADICYTDAERFGEGASFGTKFSDALSFPEGDVLDALLRTNFIVNSSVMLTKRVVERIGLEDERFRRLPDYEYWLRASLAGVRFCCVHEPLVRYRMHAAQQGKKVSETLAYLVALYVKMLGSPSLWTKGKALLALHMAARNAFSLVKIRMQMHQSA